MVVIEEHDGMGRPIAISLERVHVCMKINDISCLNLNRKIVDQRIKIGQVKSVEMNSTRIFKGNYVHVRAKVNVLESLARFALECEWKEGIMHMVKYEKM